MSRSYLDALSGQPLHEQARAAFEAFSARSWADPSQSHHEGRLAAQILQAARETVASVLKIDATGVSFHNSQVLPRLAVAGIATGTRSELYERVAITSPVERDAVLRAIDEQVAPGSIASLPVGTTGKVAPSDVAQALLAKSDKTPFVVLQVGNTEVGTLQPLAQVIDLAAAQRAPVITDATGALGLVQIPAGWSALIADATTWAGPAGVGVLAIADPQAWHGSFPRDGVSVIDAATTAAALDATVRSQPYQSESLHTQTERIRAWISEAVTDVDLLGEPTSRLPHVVTFSVLYADGERLASELDRAGVAIGSGSACASRAGLPSHVLEAIGALTHGNVRISLPIDAPPATIDHLLAVLPAAIETVRAEAGVL